MDTSHDTDTDELTANEIRSLERLESFMRGRGYRRDKRGFWVDPLTALKYTSEREER